MAAFKIHKVTSLPGTLEAHAMYLVENGTFAETYVTNASGVARSMGNTAMIQSVAQGVVNTALADENLVEVVADITARNALPGTGRNFFALVLDASADSGVDSGAALYAYQESNTTWHKLAEYESLGENLTFAWGSLTGGPSSSPAQIDATVAAQHSHTNKSVLDLLTDSGGALAYNGSPVNSGGDWDTTDW